MCARIAAILFLSDDGDIRQVYMMGTGMQRTTVVLRLNQQQLELVDRTVSLGAAADRATLVRRALREYAERRVGASAAQGAEKAR